MEMKEIEIKINKQTGHVELTTSGFKGQSCEDFLNELSKRVGAKVIDKKDKPERFIYVPESELEKDKQKLTGK